MSSVQMFDPQEDLRQNIGQLVGYEGAVARPVFSEITEHLLRIRAMPLMRRYPDRQDNDGDDVLTRDLLRGLYLQRQALIYTILREGETVGVMLGLLDALPSHLGRILCGSYPGITMEEEEPRTVAAALRSLPFCASVRGVPTPKKDNGMDRLLRGLAGSSDTCWAYAVLARPLDPGMIASTLARLAAESQRVKNTFLRPYTAEQDNNPLAQYYFDLLKAALDQYTAGQVQGCWASEAFFLSDSRAVLDSGMTILASIFCGDQSVPVPLRVSRCAGNGQGLRCPTVLNSSQLSSLVHLPSAEMPGYEVRPATSFGAALPEHRDGNCLAIGRVMQDGRVTGEWWTTRLDDLTKHALITGVTGLGKTETCHFLLDQLWREHGVPYLVIEPSKKREYRDLLCVDGHQALTVFSPSGAGGTPLRLNPFEMPENTPVQTHIDSLRCLFTASFAGLYPPLPYLLEEALYGVYRKRGWDIAGRNASCGNGYPTLSDFCAEVEDVANNSGYDSETTQNVATSLRVRLNSWRQGIKGLLLNDQESTPMDLLFTRPSVIELAEIADPELISFVMGLVLIRLYEYLARMSLTRTLRGVVVLEEAHNLLARGLDNAGNIEVSNIRGQAVEAFCTMLAEVRAFGQGFVIVDQSPTKLHPDAIKGTNLKIVHRLVAQDDRAAIGGSANMNEDQQRFLSVLRAGEAVVYSEGCHQPYLVKVPEFRRYALNRETG